MYYNDSKGHDRDFIDVRQTAGANLGKLVKNVFIHPSSKERQIWNIIITMFLIYNGLVIPMRIAFDLVEDLGAFVFDRIIDFPSLWTSSAISRRAYRGTTRRRTR
jgi:hypothetical protein